MRRLILPQEDADVLLVLFLLEVLEEGEDALEPTAPRIEELRASRGRQPLPRRVERNALALRELGERAPLVVVARLGPRIDRAFAQRPARVRDDERLVVLERRAESVAALTRAARAVERKQLRRRRRGARAIVGALVAFGESKPVRRPRCERCRNALGEQDDAIAVALAEGGADRIGEATARFVADDKAVDDDKQFLGERDVDRGREQVVEVRDRPVDADADEALRSQVLDDDLVRDFGRPHERKGDVEPDPRPQRQHRVDDGLHGVGAHLAAAQRTERVSDAGPEQPQVVVDLRRRPDRRAGGLGGVLLLDRHRRREPVDRVDVRLFHALQELARVRGQRLDVAALSLSVDGVERQRGLSRSRRSGDDRECSARDLEVEAFEVVLARPADEDGVLHDAKVKHGTEEMAKDTREIGRLTSDF